MPRARRVALVGTLGALLVGSFLTSAAADPDAGFQVTGVPLRIAQAEDAESAAGGVDTVTAGRYRIALPPDDTYQWLAVDKVVGTSLWVTMVTRLPIDPDYDDEFHIWIGTPDGEECNSSELEVSSEDGYRGPVPIGVLVDPSTVDEDAQASCFDADRLLVGLGREPDDDDGTLPAELHVLEEPQVSNVIALPEADSAEENEFDPSWRTAESVQVKGATSFPDAPYVGNGRYRDRIRPGGVRLYRVDADFGQRVKVVVNVPALPSGDAARLSDDLELDVAVLGPSREPLEGETGSVSDDSNAIFGGVTPTLRYRNRESSGWALQPASIAGPLYVLVTARTDDVAVELPYQLDIRVTGKVSGPPPYTGPGAPNDPERVPRDDSLDRVADDAPAAAAVGWPVAGPVLVGVAAALVICAIGLLLRRRRA